jgi:rhodanese-related sulfurtransferase
VFDIPQLTEYVDQLNAGDLEAIFKIPLPDCKAERGKIHQLIRAELPFLESSSQPAEKVIMLYCKSGVTSGRQHKKLGLDPRGKKKPPAKFI